MVQRTEIAHEFLIEECKRGNRKAQHKIYELYARPLYGTALRITGDTMEAQDVIQESFIDAFRHLATFRKESTFGAWLKRIVVNKSLNVVKKRRLPVTELTSNHEDVEEEEGYEEPAYSIEMVRDAMQELPEGYRIVFSLFAMEGYAHKDIAEQLGITESTSKSQYNRAKKKIRALVLQKLKHG